MIARFFDPPRPRAEDQPAAIGRERGEAVVAGGPGEPGEARAVGVDGGDVDLLLGPGERRPQREGDPIAMVRPRGAEEPPLQALVERPAPRAVDVHHVELGEAAAGEGQASTVRREGGEGPGQPEQPQVRLGGRPQGSTFGTAIPGVLL